MVRLDKNKIQKKIPSNNIYKKPETVHNKNSSLPMETLGSDNSELERFSQFVLKTIIDDNVPPTPTNFQIYFERLLENKPLAFKKKINEYIELDSSNEDEYRAKMEKDIKEGFVQIKNIMRVISTVYKNLNIMEQLVKKRSNELKINVNKMAITNIITNLETDLSKLSTLTKKQMETLKSYYEKTATILRDVENKAIFDTRYGIYNKKYLLTALEKELISIEKYNHKSSLVMIRLKDTVLNKITSSKERELLIRNIAKLLLKTSRRSDILAHYSNGIFAIIMKHTDINSAKKACERIADLIYSTSFFVGDQEIETDVELGIMPIETKYSPEEIISGALEVLPKTGKNLEIYLVANDEGES